LATPDRSRGWLSHPTVVKPPLFFFLFFFFFFSF
jgi:hypothetical protein